ncbi:DMT family transporter [Ancylobacter pratisalsi]|uniref:EamA family transporter n=1 Tax=Ancylobacter pratisalsi TaxID=1745854 RepID=A0A6P1YIA7_9HYPH|nr:EamA family transporter [Ancylobacter pratisalsi]QIB32451.1 EamA family transporter [Ancylobacter pratisalsi]
MPIRHSFLALTVVCVWALNIIIIKLGVAELPPIMMCALRFVLVSVLVVPFTRVPPRRLPAVMLVSVTFGTLHFGLLFVALDAAEAGTSAVIIQLGAPIATLLSCLVFHEKLGALRMLGLVISILGIAILAAGPTLPGVLPFTLLLISATAWAVTNLIIKAMPDVTPMTMMGWSSLFAIPQLLLASWLFEFDRWGMVATAGWNGWFTVAYSAIASSIVGYGIWYWLLQRHAINAVVPYSMLNPLLAVLFGIVLIGDDPSPVKIVGALVMVAGVALILRPRDVVLPDTA